MFQSTVVKRGKPEHVQGLMGMVMTGDKPCIRVRLTPMPSFDWIDLFNRATGRFSPRFSIIGSDLTFGLNTPDELDELMSELDARIASANTEIERKLATQKAESQSIASRLARF